jgi:hypothetical protein
LPYGVIIKELYMKTLEEIREYIVHKSIAVGKAQSAAEEHGAKNLSLDCLQQAYAQLLYEIDKD